MIPRRKFLNALLALGSAKALPAFATKLGLAPFLPSSPGIRSAPLKPVVLKSDTLSVTIDAADGLPYAYDFAGETLWGEDTGAPATAILCRLHPREYRTLPLKVTIVQQHKRTASIVFDLPWDAQPAARLSLSYSLDNATLDITLQDVVEHPGFELIEVSLPNLATVRAGEPAAWVAQGRNGGSFVRVASAKPYSFPDDAFFGRISTQLPIGLLGKGKLGCLMEVSAFMDGTETSIVETESSLRARIGTVQVHRVHGGRCYNMNNGGPAACGNADTPNLLVGQTPRCRLDFYSIASPDAPWFPAMKLLRARMPLSPTDYYNDKLLYLIAGKSKVDALPHTTFAQSRQLIQDLAHLTDHAPQVALISGWVYDGQDTGYPSDDVVNSSLGTYAELMQLMHDGPGMNANVTVNENFDDAYKSSPQFNLDFIAREPNGVPWKSLAWDGEDSYIVGMAKYVAGGWAKRRIAATLARYKLRDAMLIDALSWYAIRNDWDPQHPASGYKNLVEGKWVILDEFRRRGVHIASEQFRYPMLGKLALSVDGPESRPCPFGGEPVPLTSIVYRKSAIYGNTHSGLLRPKEDLFWNTRPGMWFEHKTDRRDITDFYYLVTLPYSKIHRLDVEAYASSGTQRTLKLESGAEVTMDTAGPAYRVVWNGATIATDLGTTCPVDDSRIAFYSRKGGRMSYPLPPGWNANTATARLLTTSDCKNHPLQIEAGQLVVDTPARTPVMVYAAAPDAKSGLEGYEL